MGCHFYKEGGRPFHLDFQRIVINSANTELISRHLAGRDCFTILDIILQADIRSGSFRRDGASPGPDKVLRGYRVLIGPDGIFAQMKDPEARLLALFPTFSNAGARL